MAMFKPLHTRRRRLVFSSSSHIRTKRGQESEIHFEKKKRLIIFTILPLVVPPPQLIQFQSYK